MRSPSDRPLILILLCHAHDEPEIRFRQLFKRLLVPFFNALREVDLLFGSQQIDFADLL